MKEEEIKIEYLKFPECVRHRVGMYLSSTENFNQPFLEICSNAQDELSQGYGDTICLSTNFNGYLFVGDNGRGLPIYMADGEFSHITQAELSLTKLHAGSKFKDTGDQTFRVGMNGVGSSAVQAVSEVYIVLSKITPENYNRSVKDVENLWNSCGPRSKRDLFYVLVFERGYKTFEGAMKLKDVEKKFKCPGLPEGMSTMVLFKGDKTLYDSVEAEIPYDALQYFLLIQEKFFNRKSNIIIDGISLKRDIKPYKYELTTTLIPKDNSVNKSVSVYMTFEVDEKNLGGKDIIGSINGLPSTGLHLTTAENCFKTAIKDFYKIKRDTTLVNGLKMCVVILAQEVLFDSQTKERLKSITKVKPADFAPVVKGIEKIFRKNPDYWEPYIAKLQALHDSMRDIGAQEKAQKMIEAASNTNQLYRNKQNLIPGFTECTGTDRWNCEIFVVEGLSPAGSLKNARKADEVKHASILALRGKVLDVSGGMTASKMLTNAEFYTLFSVFGLGLDQYSVIKDAKSPEEAYEIIKRKTRYGKLIIATDSDEDGSSIMKGILFCICKFARFMIDYGIVYIAESPIFKQNDKYYYPSDPRITGSQFCVGMDPSKPFKRYKGLTKN